MKKTVTSYLLIITSFIFVSCANYSSSNNSLSLSNNSDSKIRGELSENISSLDGGSESKIVGLYVFNSTEEFIEFYNIFKMNNSERFLFPKSSETIWFTYKFRTEGIKMSDFDSKRYDLDFDLINVFFEFEYKNNIIEFETYNLNEFSINKESESSISYRIMKKNKDYYVSYFFNENEFAQSNNISAEVVSESDFISILDNLSLLLLGGLNYAY